MWVNVFQNSPFVYFVENQQSVTIRLLSDNMCNPLDVLVFIKILCEEFMLSDGIKTLIVRLLQIKNMAYFA